MLVLLWFVGHQLMDHSITKQHAVSHDSLLHGHTHAQLGAKCKLQHRLALTSPRRCQTSLQELP